MTQKCCYDRVIDKEASAENLKKIRQGKGLSVKKVQYLLGRKSDCSIYKWENAHPFPETRNLANLVMLYNVRFSDALVFVEGDLG